MASISRTPYSEDRVQLIVTAGPRGQQVSKPLKTWTTYEFTEDLFTPANHWTFELSLSGAGTGIPSEEYIERVALLTQPDAVVQLQLDGVLLSTGVIVDQYIGDDEKGLGTIQISGFDPAGLLMANEVDTSLKIDGDTTLPQVAETLLAKYRGLGIGLEVVADDIANRSLLSGKLIQSGKTVQTSRGRALVSSGKFTPPTGFVKNPIADVRPHPAETEWDFIARHAQNLAVIPFFTADGDLTFISPDYEQDELYRFSRYRGREPDKGNILSGGRRRSNAATATSVEVLGRGSLYRSTDRGGTKSTRVKKPPVKAEAKTDLPFIWPRRRYIRDTNPHNNEDALRVAKRELAHRNANGIVYDYVVAGHTNSAGYRYTVNTMAHIHDEKLRPVDDLSAYLVKRVLRKRPGGPAATTTGVTLVPKGAIVL